MRKRFVGKAFESVIEMGNLYSVVVENVVAETNDFFQAFLLFLATFNVFNVELFKQRQHFYLSYKI